MEDLASLVQAAMTERGMSRRDVEAAADRHGYKVSHSTVSKIAKGNYTSPGERILVGLSKALDIPISRLRDAAGVAEPGTPFRLPEHASRLSSSERAAVEHIVRVMVESKDSRKVVTEDAQRDSASIGEATEDEEQSEDERSEAEEYGLAAHPKVKGVRHDEPLEEQGI